MVQNAYYSQEVHGGFELFELGDFPLEQGGTLSDCKVAYVTLGELSAAKDNAILFPTWFSGTHKMLADVYVGQHLVRAGEPGGEKDRVVLRRAQLPKSHISDLAVGKRASLLEWKVTKLEQLEAAVDLL